MTTAIAPRVTRRPGEVRERNVGRALAGASWTDLCLRAGQGCRLPCGVRRAAAAALVWPALAARSRSERDASDAGADSVLCPFEMKSGGEHDSDATDLRGNLKADETWSHSSDAADFFIVLDEHRPRPLNLWLSWAIFSFLWLS